MSRSVLVIVAAVIAAFLAFVAAATAPFTAPALAAKFQCPPNTTLRISEYHASWNRPGETGISIGCVDASGTLQDSSKYETPGFWILTVIFFAAFFGVFLLAGALILLVRRKKAGG